MTDHESLALNKLIATCVCVKKKCNTPEFMRYFAERINEAIAAMGSDDRVKWPGDWSNEFHLESGALPPRGADDGLSAGADLYAGARKRGEPVRGGCCQRGSDGRR